MKRSNLITVTCLILIDNTLEEVFAFISNYKNDNKWRKGVIQVLQFPEYLTYIGTTTIETKKILGQKYYISAEVYEYERNKRVSSRTTDGIYTVTINRDVLREGSKTKFIYSLTVYISGVLRLFSLFIGYYCKYRINNDLKKLRHLLEEN